MGEDVGSWPTGRLLSVAARMVEGRYHRLLADWDLTHAGLIVLHHLVGGPRSQRELAHLCRVTDQTMSRTIERLARTGHVERTPDGRDRRRTLVTIGAEGVDALAVARREERRSERLFGAVEDYDNFRRQLITLITAVTEADPDDPA
ncbi:MarR family winged helix-turn-helix transcriptional regulator [Amorphoplanes digitatis]|uniref:DNA-binding MarR family transcriptional regulator n=1 Tax=Actinoplanes digitatis TaxID=1868 RepID=A0A7W7I143_9ACTN|nr:MarR family winged helix-turn-helix transcriptional regulator [Actinoplanes digitatis]MBB4764517.1 DNA-binding MarR family transcriptional regulator [Actinoplanes digitatis]GID91531.1 MarR family transcriptional regulator [Actinoplanes digitatis]